MDGVNGGGMEGFGADGVGLGAGELPEGLLSVEEPPAHVWSAALYAALSADPDVAAELAALVPVDPAPAGEGGGADGDDLGWDPEDGPPDDHLRDNDPDAPGGIDLPGHHAGIDDPGHAQPGAADPHGILDGDDLGTDAWGEWSP